MKLGDTLKKIYNSFDFRGNRIKNLRVDTPLEKPDYREDGYNVKKDFVANKEYVDKVTTFDTEKAKKYKNPFIQWWMKNVDGLPYKELLDNLFFPQLPAEYIDPVIENISLSVEKQLLVNADNYWAYDKPNMYKMNHDDVKYIVWDGQELVFDVSININPGDRISNVVSTIEIFDGDAVKHTFNSDATDDDFTNIHCTVPNFKKNYKIVFKKVFNSTKEVKNDTYGEPSPVENSKFTLEMDLTEYFNSKCWIIDTMLTKLRTDEGDCVTDSSKYTVSNHCIFPATSEGIFDIAIPNKWNRFEYVIGYKLFEQSGTDMILFGEGILELNNIKRPIVDGSEGTFNYNNIPYTLHQYNFGYTEKNTDIYLYPIFLKKSAQFVS